MIRLLVVGGNGFIGQHVVQRALKCGWFVTSLNLSSKGIGQSTPTLQNKVADIADIAVLRTALGEARYDYVVNCGGYIDHRLFFKGGREVLHTHFQGVVNLVALLNREDLKAFVNIGSSDEYGQNLAPQVETQREMPNAPYAVGKVATTHFLQALYRTENFPSTTLRLFLTYGPGQDASRFLPQIIRGCLRDENFPTSAGMQIRDFCFVEDTVDAIFASLSCQAVRGEVINVGSGDPVSIRKMIEHVREIVGKGSPQYGAVPYRSGENMALYANCDKARTLMSWEQKVPLVIGLERTIDWFKGQT